MVSRLLILAALCLVASAQSPIVTAQSGNRRYALYNSAKTWSAAASFCASTTYQGLPGWLAVPEDANQLNILSNLVTNLGTYGKMWLGGSDIANYQNGQWRWVQGPLGLGEGGYGTTFYTGVHYNDAGAGCIFGQVCAWYPGQPDNWGGNQFNVAMNSFGYNYGWDDLAGATSLAFTCMYKFQTPADLTCGVAQDQCQSLAVTCPVMSDSGLQSSCNTLSNTCNLIQSRCLTYAATCPAT